MVSTVYGIPVEIYKHVSVCKAILIKLLQKIWVEEDVPSEFAKIVFVMFLLQTEGITQRPNQVLYRCIDLLVHTYKALSRCRQKNFCQSDKLISDATGDVETTL